MTYCLRHPLLEYIWRIERCVRLGKHLLPTENIVEANEIEAWLTAPAVEALMLQRPLSRSKCSRHNDRSDQAMKDLETYLDQQAAVAMRDDNRLAPRLPGYLSSQGMA